MSEVSFDRAGEGDFQFLIEAIERYYAYDGIPFDRAEISLGLLQLLENETLGCSWIIRNSETSIGYAILGFGFDLEFGGRHAVLTDLFVDRAHRRSGTGTGMLEHIEKFCLSQGIGAIELQVETDNAEALALYERRGFVRNTRYAMSKRLRT